MAWRVEFLPVAEKQFSKLDRPVQRRVAAFLVERIATDENPRRLGDALEGPLTGSGGIESVTTGCFATLKTTASW